MAMIIKLDDSWDRKKGQKLYNTLSQLRVLGCGKTELDFYSPSLFLMRVTIDEAMGWWVRHKEWINIDKFKK